ncbi:hypothetical protein GCM10010218_53060 [Streptomyces mashuensis]|uniref:Uncharacterized protein n=1 Tax=Streptomyces mashuensis TaxID=33904 RepID=A0A919B7R9_9ACTN|nr:hypothetical protein [Streptomyces mashuensis]GHF64992.1 hypothetical protein GCM10010218_53060 [Streptomyces mashuensis]
MSRAYRITYTQAAYQDLIKLGQLLADEVTAAIDAEITPDPHGGTSMERPLGGGRWDRVALAGGWATVRYLVSDAPGIDPPMITVIRIIP